MDKLSKLEQLLKDTNTKQEFNIVEDLKTLADAGVEIVACGTCLEFYQLKEKLAVGKIVNMLNIVERQAKATKVVKP